MNESKEAKKFIDQEIDKLVKEKKELEKAEEIKNTKALDLCEEIKALKVQRDEINKLLTEKILELNKHCTHERVRSEESYSSGSYLNKEEYITIYYCDICGVEVDRKVKYGGYG